MAESKSPRLGPSILSDGYHDSELSDRCSADIEDPVSRIKEVHISSEVEESNNVESSVQKHPAQHAEQARIGNPGGDLPVQSFQVATECYLKFRDSGNIADVNKAISLFREEVAGLPVGSKNYIATVNNLGAALLSRFRRGGQGSDLNEAIALHRQALELQLPPHHHDQSGSLNKLAAALSTRFKQGAQKSDLDEAISLNRQALKLQVPPHTGQTLSLNDLASALWIRFEQEGQRSDLDEAISLYRQTLELVLPTHSDRSMSLNNLANSLLTLFDHEGQQSDLDEAISLFRQALEHRLPPHPDRFLLLNNLSNSLLTRFNQGGQQRDLDEAISLHREALEPLFPAHPLQSLVLNNLADALSTRFKKRGQQSDLDEAISLFRTALEFLLPSHPHQHNLLNNLATTLSTRFEQGGQQSDLDEAISLHRKALELCLPPHPGQFRSLNNLGATLWTRFELEGQQGDLDEAISLHRQALELQLPAHPDRPGLLNNLAFVLFAKYQQAGQQCYLDEAMSVFLAATQCLPQPPSLLLNNAKAWAHHADRGQHISAIDAYEVALHALPQVAALSLDVSSRQEALTDKSDGLAQDASVCAIRSGNLAKAIEFLEAGRSIFWSQVLSLRSPFSQLHDIAPELAENLQNISAALELGSHRDVSADIFDNQTKLFIDQEASRLNRLNEEWVKGINQVRKLQGFEDFLRPKCLSALMPAASRHPVIILVANDDSSHCLIMRSTTIHHIPLPSLATSVLKELVHLIQQAVSKLPKSRLFVEQSQEKIIKILEQGPSTRMPKRVRSDELGSSDGIFRWVLKLLWDNLVKPVIDFLNIQKMGEMPVLHWCATGLFTFLPIHASGCYDIETGIDCAPDYFISSYTPTIGALTAQFPVPTAPKLKVVVVISQELPSSSSELANIEQHVPASALVKLGIPGTPADIEVVVSCLSEASIVHFACHGKQDQLKPLNSGLYLDDGMLPVSRIVKQTMLSGSLAFLCACETGMGDEKLPDEALSLGSSLLFSGFRSVVATMWEMMDKDGPVIADSFYKEIFQGADRQPALEPDTTKSAQALHVAVQNLRSQNVPFCRWVPFIHMGK